MKLKTIIATTYSNELLNMNLNGKIQSIYNRTINIVNSDSKIYTICQEEIFNGPRQIKLSQADFKQLDSQTENRVSYSKSQIKIGNVVIVLEDVPFYQLHPIKFPKILPNQISLRIDEIEADLIHRLDTVGFFMKKKEDDIKVITNNLLKKYANMLMCGIGLESKKIIEESVKHLIGLGFGLTPSGDDFLTGVSLIINSQNYPFNKTRLIINSMIKKYRKNTNIISINELELAMEGKSLEPIMRFIDALYVENELFDLNPLLDEILQIGSSSGSDILFGLLSGLKATNEKIKQSKSEFQNKRKV